MHKPDGGLTVPLLCLLSALTIASLTNPPTAFGLRKPGKPTGQDACEPLGKWTSEVKGAEFRNAHLEGNGTLSVFFPTGAPKEVQNQTLPGKKQKVSDEVTLRVYADFPRNGAGKPSGIRFRPEPKETISRFGALGFFVADCCPQGCFIPTITKFTIQVKRDGAVVATITDQTGPKLDGVTKQEPCGTPSFEPKPNPKKDRHGFADYPGVAEALDGLVTKNAEGQEFTYKKGDVVSIVFQARVFLRCDNKILAFVDWGFKANVTIGTNVETSTFSDDSAMDPVEITGSNETDPDKKKKFEDGVKVLGDLLK